MALPKIIGLTGNIGSGKSTVAALFELQGWPVFTADAAGKIILKENNAVVQKVITAFGSDVVNNQGHIVPKKLAAAVFNDAKKIAQLNAIIHPEVGHMFNRWLNAQTSSFVIRESALLFESGINTQSFKNITVSCPYEERMKRVLLREGITGEEVDQREKLQMKEDEKIKRSDFTIINFNSPLLPQVITVYKKITALK